MSKSSLSVLLIISFLVALSDFTSRLIVDDIELSTLAASDSQDKPDITFLAEDNFAKIEREINRFEKPKPKVKQNKPSKPKVQIMSLEQQNAQQGVKEKLFSGEKEYSLVAIFAEQADKFALLSERHLVSGTVKSVKLVAQEALDNYKVKQIGNNHIELVDGDRVISLQLFLKNKS